jgi:putative alpha-1,2-mannosidase
MDDSSCLLRGSGMAKAVADTDQDNAGGYSSNGWNIRGFSHMHDSGTGGVRRSA